MPIFAKWMLVVVGVLLAACMALMIAGSRFRSSGPPAQEHQQRESVLVPLWQSHASRLQVTQALPLDFIDYSRDSTNHAALNQWLAREPSTSFVRVREGAAR